MEKYELTKYIGNQIRKHRKAHKMNQQDLGNLVNLKDATISEYERGNISIDIFTLTKIANVFNIQVADLLPSLDDEPMFDVLDAFKSVKLDRDQLELFQRLVNRTKNLSPSERTRFIETLKLTLEIHNKLTEI